MMPRILDTEFSVLRIFGREIPTVSTVVATGKLVGRSATRRATASSQLLSGIEPMKALEGLTISILGSVLSTAFGPRDGERGHMSAP